MLASMPTLSTMKGAGKYACHKRSRCALPIMKHANEHFTVGDQFLREMNEEGRLHFRIQALQWAAFCTILDTILLLESK
ncbi:unnamed protein product [Dovyalis caffra]|uniref:Uncharacterized protein n=1 Tax=Dovyalis caffra TaxID=77055 RepID=A0AAV1RFY0_9ROSI|nr:unnamed protein product [Dovyalis caffra]